MALLGWTSCLVGISNRGFEVNVQDLPTTVASSPAGKNFFQSSPPGDSPNPASDDVPPNEHRQIRTATEWLRMNYIDNFRSLEYRRHICFVLLLLVTLPFFWSTLRTLFIFAFTREYCSHIFLILPITATLIYLRRKAIYQKQSSGGVGGIFVLLAGFGVFELSRRFASQWGPYEAVSIGTAGILLAWLGVFIFSYGSRSFRIALFPLLFLFWMIPIPVSVLERMIFLLQEGSAAIAEVLFHWSSVPVFRQGFIFSLPGLTIEVAKECSGIRSSLALTITVMLFSYLFLRRIWKRALLVALALPLAVIKNAIRIVVLTLLSIRVNPNFMRGPLHQEGGILFFVLALLLIAPVLLWLERSEAGAAQILRPQKAPGDRRLSG